MSLTAGRRGVVGWVACGLLILCEIDFSRSLQQMNILIFLLAFAPCTHSWTQQRGGGRGGAVGPVERTLSLLGAELDVLLKRTEREASRLKQRLREQNGLTTGDAAVAGALVGFICSKTIVGNSIVMGVVGSASFAYAHQRPDSAPPMLCRLADRGAGVVAHVRRR